MTLDDVVIVLNQIAALMVTAIYVFAFCQGFISGQQR